MNNQGTSEFISERFSLLWPPSSLKGSASAYSQLSQTAWRDLALDNIVLALTPDQDHQRVIAKILAILSQDPSVIQYRQDVIDDLLHNQQLVNQLEVLLPTIDALGRYSYQVEKGMNTLHEITWRMGELQSIVDCIEGLGTVFQEVKPTLVSEGLLSFLQEITRVREDQTYQDLVQQLPELLSQLRTCASVTIGVNLDTYLRPVEATLLSVNNEKFTSQSILNRLFGKKGDKEGIAPLHTVPKDVNIGWTVEPMMVPLFQDLAKVIDKTTQPIVKQLSHYAGMKSQMFVSLRQDLIFYLGALRFIKRMEQHGLPLCRPTLAPRDERIDEVDEAYNVNLALHLSDISAEQNLTALIIQNDICIGPEGRIMILTGPNQGGKTTYMQGVGIVQVLAQVGLYVPGRLVKISPVDNIYTHFPIEEKPEEDTGRFGEEAKRLAEIFKQVTRYSLVLLNETLSNTSAGESLYLAQDIIRILRRIGARAIYSTHLHELANQIDELNKTTQGDSKIISVVSSPIEEDQPITEEFHRSYKVEVRPPLGRSYAREIAARYGISFEQLEKLLMERGVL